MDERIKTTLIAVFCIFIIAASFIGMQYLRSMYSQETIEIGGIGFKVPIGYSYVNGSHQQLLDDLNNETVYYKIVLQNQDKIIEFRQYNTTLELTGSAVTDVKGISVYKIDTGSKQHFGFNFNGKGYMIKSSDANDQLVIDIVKSMEALP